MIKRNLTLFKFTLTIVVSIFLCAGIASAFDIELVPSNIQRAPGSDVRINIHSTGATDLISMGVQVSFDPDVLQAAAVGTGTGKYLDCNEGWVMDADGDCGTTDDQYTTPDVEVDNTAGTVTMIGGRLMGDATDGLDDPVIGWITFTVIGADGDSSDLSVDFAHPSSTTYEHFVMLDGTTVDSTYTPDVKGAICVDADPCDGNVNGDNKANVLDLGVINPEFGNTECNDPGPGCQSDMNNDGKVNVIDLSILKEDFGRIDCGCP
jgi:hypothetical protein